MTEPKPGTKTSATSSAQTSAKAGQEPTTELDLDLVAERFTAEVRQGKHQSVENFLTEFCRTTEVSVEDIETLRDLLHSIALIEGIKESTETSVPAEQQIPIEFDGYRLLRELGRGGMGIVYEAMHRSLGRRVAVKVLSRGLLGEAKHLARFKVEARAAARLRHPNIVTVFGVGESGEHHYLVMDFIEGLSLRQTLWHFIKSAQSEPITQVEINSDTKQVTPVTRISPVDVTQENAEFEVDEKLTTQLPLESSTPIPDWLVDLDVDSPEYFAWVARTMASIADALHYAHEQGVLHRDVKPANLLVDHAGQVWVADFGLAKLSEQQTMTNTGDVLGTPQYMPPEAFGKSYDTRSEVYSLGLTLYELLARRPAIEGHTPADTIRKATIGKMEAPSKANPNIPADLETIALHALEVEPERRYASAAHLRDDLQRFLSQTAIEARRPSLVGRTISWIRREPILAALTLSIIGLLTTLSLVGGWAYWRTGRLLSDSQQARSEVEHALAETKDALALARDQQRRAESNFQVALQAFDEVMENVAGRGSQLDAQVLGEITDSTAPNVGPEDAELLKSLLGFFDQLASNNDDDLLAESAMAASRAGEIYMSLGELRKAGESYFEARKRYLRLLDKQPTAQHQLLLLATLNELATISSLRGDVPRAYSFFTDSAEFYESEALLDLPPGKFEIARSLRLFASLPNRAGFLVSLANRAGPAAFQNSEFGGRRAMTWLREEQDLQSVEQAIVYLNELTESHPNQLQYEVELARAYRNKAEIYSRRKNRRESETAISQAIDILESLVEKHADSDALQFELALTLVSLENVGFNQMFRALRASDLSEALLRQNPNLPRFVALQALTLENRAVLEKRSNRFEPSRRHLSAAVRLYEGLTEERAEVNIYHNHHCRCLELLGEISLEQGNEGEARTYFQAALESLHSDEDRRMSNPSRIQKQRLLRKLQRLP